jgi:transposase-like protein
MENDEDIDTIEEMILEEGKKSTSKTSLVCPVCNSSNVTYYLGGQIGYMYQCKDCGYIGALVIEKCS